MILLVSQKSENTIMQLSLLNCRTIQKKHVSINFCEFPRIIDNINKHSKVYSVFLGIEFILYVIATFVENIYT